MVNENKNKSSEIFADNKDSANILEDIKIMIESTNSNSQEVLDADNKNFAGDLEDISSPNINSLERGSQNSKDSSSTNTANRTQSSNFISVNQIDEKEHKNLESSDSMISAVRKWKDYLLLDDDYKNSHDRKVTSVIIFVSIGLFAILLFVISYWVALSNAQDIKDLQHARSKHIEDMININVNTYSPDYLVSKEKVKYYINSVKTNSLDIQAFNNFIDTFNEYKVSNIKHFLEADKNFNVHNYLEKISNNFKQEVSGLIAEKSKLLNQLDKLEENYKTNIKAKLDFKDSVSANLDKHIIYTISKDSICLNNLNIKFIDFKYNKIVDTLKINDLKANFKQNQKYTDTLKEYTNAIFLDNSMCPDCQFHEFYKSMLSDIDSHNIKKAKLIKEIAEKNELIDAKKNSQLSLDKYKQNKTYLFQKQFLINNEMIQFSINKGIRYLAFYNALIIVILTFTAILTLCIFGISTKGWSSANDQLKILTIIVLVVLGISNLILVTLKPKDNYMAYIKSADKNENIQMDIINFFNNYEKLNEIQIDSMLKRNLQQLTRFNEILPETDDSKLIQEFDKINPSNVK